MNILKSSKCLRTDALRVTDCLNLRPASTSAGDVLAVVGAPKIIAPESWSPLVRVGEQLFVTSGNTVGVISDDGVQQIATLPSAARCAYASQQYVTIMTGDGPYIIRRENDGTFTDAGLKPDFGAIAVTAKLLSNYESTVAACKVVNITPAVTAAYREIVETARLGGAFVQPVVARCRLLDADRNVLHVTAPVVVMLPEGATLAEPWQFVSDDDGVTVNAKTVSAHAYRLRVTVGDAIPSAWRKIVQTIEVQATPQFHPIDFSGDAEVALGRAINSGKAVSVTLPGAERGISTTRNLASAELLKRAIERFDSIAETAAYISNPFDGDGDTVITYAAPIDVADEADNLAAALSKTTPEHVSPSLARLSLPHTFTADAVAHSADTVVWAGIAPQRFVGYSAGIYASTFEQTACTGFIAVDFVNGERIVHSFSSNIAPTTLSPLITYPSAEAVSMTIAIRVSGEDGMRTLTMPLAADATGMYGYYVAPNLLPISMQTSDALATPNAVSAAHDMPGYAAICNDGAVPDVTAVANVADEVTAVIAARSGSSAWEYRRARFYAFGNDGIKLLTANSARSECAVNLLDCRRIDNKYCVSDGGNVVYALCSGEILQIANNTVKTVAQNVTGDRLAWIAADNEIVAGNTDDCEATHYCPDYAGCSYASTLVPRGPWLAVAGKAYAVVEGGLVDLSTRETSATTDVHWAAIHTVNTRKKALPAAVRWMLKASSFKGTLTVARMWLTGISPTPQTVSRMSVEGAIKSPITCRLHGHRSLDLQLVVDGSVSRDFTITYPKIATD